jgi:hypothetical protein
MKNLYNLTFILTFILFYFIDKLLVVESVGVHIESKGGLGIFSSTEFLPWDIVEDVFINEVIKGVSLYLVINIKEETR